MANSFPNRCRSGSVLRCVEQMGYPELPLALGLHRSDSHQTPLSTTDELSPSPSLKGVFINEGSSHEEESVNLNQLKGPSYTV